MNPTVEAALIAAGVSIISLGGTVAVAIAGFRNSRTVTMKALEMTREGQVTDRYSKAIEQLGSSDMGVRIGGIYALERVARDSDRDHPAVMEVLAALVRQHSHDPSPRSGDTFASEFMIMADVQAAVSVLGHRNPAYDHGHVDLQRADLTGADLRNARLEKAWLHEVNFTGADLSGANLAGAILFEADFTRATLDGVDLTDVMLASAQLIDANLAQTRSFSPRYLDQAQLASANLSGLDLTGVSMRSANLSRADCTGANFTRADLFDANLRRAKFIGAKLMNADLTSASYDNADFTGADLTGVLLEEHWTPPVGWLRDTDSGRLFRSRNTPH